MGKNSPIKQAQKFLSKNSVIIMFAILCIFGIKASGLTMEFVARELITRIGRNSFLVLSLIIPVVAGMGLNFGIVCGAMAAQIAMVLVTNFGYTGLPGILVCVLIATPLSALIGFLAGNLLNRMKGQETIGSLFLGYFSGGIYQFIMLVLMGGLIPISNQTLLIGGEMGIKNTIDLKDGLGYGLDDLIRVPAALFINGILAIVAVYAIIKFLVGRKNGTANKKSLILTLVLCLAGIGLVMIPRVYYVLYYIDLPLVTFLIICALIVFNRFILNTRLGQNMRTVGQSRVAANASGLKVDRIRVIAIIISTVFASWGQIISLQNIGTIQTYNSHEQIGLFSVAAILVGGASLQKATNAQAIIGVILFHTLFIISPVAGKNLFNNAQIGEYFRVAVAYAVICLSLMMYAMKANKSKMKKAK